MDQLSNFTNTIDILNITQHNGNNQFSYGVMHDIGEELMIALQPTCSKEEKDEKDDKTCC